MAKGRRSVLKSVRNIFPINIVCEGKIIDGPMRSPKLVDDHLMPVMQFLDCRILCQGREGLVSDFVQDLTITFFFAGLPAL